MIATDVAALSCSVWALFAIASLASTVFTSPIELIAARGVAGAGAAFIMPATLSILTATYRDDERAKAVGIWAGVAGCGAVIGMLGSGTLLHFWSWRSIFWAFAVFAAFIFVLACTVTSSRDDEATPLDWPGAGLIAGAVAVFVFGVLEAPERGGSHTLVYGSMAAGVALAVAFGFVEMRRRHPLLDVRLFRRPDFATGSAAITVFFMALFGFFFVIMQYIQLVMGYSPIKTAFALTPLMVPMLTLSVLSQRSLPRMGLRLVMFVGLLLISAGFLWMRVLRIDSPYWDMMWPLLVMSTGIGFCTAPSTSAIMAAVPDEKQGVASAVNDTTREVGAALGIALAGSILAAKYAHVITPPHKLPRCPAGPGLPLAGSGAGDLQNAWPARPAARRAQPNRIPSGDGRVIAGTRPDHRRRGAGDRRLGAGPRRATAATGATAHRTPWRRG